MRKYYVEYAQNCGYGAANVACVVIEANDVRHLHERIKKKDFGKDEPDHNYCISYYSEIEDDFDHFISNIKKGCSTVDCIIEIDIEEFKTNKEIIDFFEDKECIATISIKETLITEEVLEVSEISEKSSGILKSIFKWVKK